MMHLVLGVNPVIAAWGQVAAIVLCLYALIFVLVALVFNLVMAIATSWLRDKANLIKMLRPTVESVNKTTEAVLHGVPPSGNENKIVRTVAEVPERVQVIDRKADQLSNKVANAAIEFRARTVQVETVIKGFFAPKLVQQELEPPQQGAVSNALEIKSPGYRILMEEKVPEAPVVPTPVPTSAPTSPTVTASQLKDAPRS